MNNPIGRWKCIWNSITNFMEWIRTVWQVLCSNAQYSNPCVWFWTYNSWGEIDTGFECSSKQRWKHRWNIASKKGRKWGKIQVSNARTNNEFDKNVRHIGNRDITIFIIQTYRYSSPDAMVKRTKLTLDHFIRRTSPLRTGRDAGM